MGHTLGASLCVGHAVHLAARIPGGVGRAVGRTLAVGHAPRLVGAVARARPIAGQAAEDDRDAQAHADGLGPGLQRGPARCLPRHPPVDGGDFRGSHRAGDDHVQELLLCPGHAAEQVLVLLHAEDVGRRGSQGIVPVAPAHAPRRFAGVGMADQNQGVGHAESPPQPLGLFDVQKFQPRLLEVGQGGLQGDKGRVGQLQGRFPGIGDGLHAVALHHAQRRVEDARGEDDEVHLSVVQAAQHLAHLLHQRGLLADLAGQMAEHGQLDHLVLAIDLAEFQLRSLVPDVIQVAVADHEFLAQHLQVNGNRRRWGSIGEYVFESFANVCKHVPGCRFRVASCKWQ